MGAVASAIESGEFNDLSGQNQKLNRTKDSTVYLRPETAQAMFVQYANIQQ